MAATPTPEPPILRYKSINSKYQAQQAQDGGELATAMKRVPARVKAVGGPLLDDFVSIIVESDKLKTKMDDLTRELDENKQSVNSLNERLEEGRTNFDLLVTRFTNSVEQATQLRKQVDEERQDTSQRHNAALKQEKLLREQVATLRRQVDAERLMALNHQKEQKALRGAVMEMEKELATLRTANTLSGSAEPRSRRHYEQREEIKKLTEEIGLLKEELTRQSEFRKSIEANTLGGERSVADQQDRDAAYQELVKKHEATTRLLEKTQERLASANDFLDVNDTLEPDEALNRVINFNEEITQFAAFLASKVVFLPVGEEEEEEFPNPFPNEDGDVLYSFLSPRFLPLLRVDNLEIRRTYLELAVQACLVYFSASIINSHCFGLREDLDAFFGQVWDIVHAENVQATAARWRALTHKSIRASPQFPVDKSLVTILVQTIGTILRASLCVQPEQTAEEFTDEIVSIHGLATALEIDFKQQVLSTTYIVKLPAVDSPFLAIEMRDVSTLKEFSSLGRGSSMSNSQSQSRTKDKGKAKVGVKTVLATVSLGLSAQAGRTRKMMHGKMKMDVRLEPAVLLDSVLVVQ